MLIMFDSPRRTMAAQPCLLSSRRRIFGVNAALSQTHASPKLEKISDHVCNIHIITQWDQFRKIWARFHSVSNKP